MLKTLHSCQELRIVVMTSEVVDGEDATDQRNLVPDQQSFGSVSTLALPSPALSSIGASAEKMKEKKGSWVWRWAEKRTNAARN
ncbi:hypothetical protein BGZ50_009837, partial [Haplosporangium sp. Z 11]